MSVLKFPIWQRLCEAALSEGDSRKLFRHIVAAETAIFQRLQQLKTGPENTEVRAMEAALQRLQLLITQLRTDWDAKGRVVTMPARRSRGSFILNKIKRHAQLAASGSDPSG